MSTQPLSSYTGGTLPVGQASSVSRYPSGSRLGGFFAAGNRLRSNLMERVLARATLTASGTGHPVCHERGVRRIAPRLWIRCSIMKPVTRVPQLRLNAVCSGMQREAANQPATSVVWC
jgi:hypothetical protein